MILKGGDITSTLIRGFSYLMCIVLVLPLTRLTAFHGRSKGGGRRVLTAQKALALVVLAVLMLVWVETASAQCGVFKTWAFREVLQSSDINSAFQRTVNANTPTCAQAYSSSV